MNGITRSLVLFCLLFAFSVTSLADPPRKRTRSASQCRWSDGNINTGVLRRRMKARGFKPPSRFRALVVKTTLNSDKTKVLRHRLWDYKGQSSRWTGWDPASTIKIYSAVSAYERLKKLGFSPNAKATFHYPAGNQTFRMPDLLEDTLHWSKNLSHNRLVQLAGFNNLNGRRGTLRRAQLEHAYIVLSYAGKEWKAEGHKRSLRYAPAITLTEGAKKYTIRESTSRRKVPCNWAACTSLSDLAKMMCLMMLHEQLPKYRRLRFGPGQGPYLKAIRRSMDRVRKGRRHHIVNIMRQRFPRPKYKLFWKGGFTRGWLSINMYLYTPGRTRWIISMVGRTGELALNEATATIADIIANGEL